MLTAETYKGERVDARKAVRGEDYFCPECRTLVILKRGAVKIPHFAHLSRPRNCEWDTGETEWHRKTKWAIYDKLLSIASWNDIISDVKLEHKVGNQRADVYFRLRGEPVAVEVQLASISIGEIHRRTIGYSQQGVAVLWVLQTGGAVVSVNTVKRLCHAMGYGGFFSWNASEEILSFVHTKPMRSLSSGRILKTKRWAEYHPVRFIELRIVKRDPCYVSDIPIPGGMVVLPPSRLFKQIHAEEQKRKSIR